jgi:hypothetical protein
MFAPYPGLLIPLNSNTIERIEEIEDEDIEDEISPEESDSGIEEKDDFEETFKPSDEKPTERIPEPPVELKEKKPKSAQEKQEEMLAYMKEMSECTHEKHDYHYTDSTVGRAKKPVRRYFPVCAKCGVREKFVKADTLTDEQKENAKEWTS